MSIHDVQIAGPKSRKFDPRSCDPCTVEFLGSPVITVLLIEALNPALSQEGDGPYSYPLNE